MKKQITEIHYLLPGRVRNDVRHDLYLDQR